jgi:SAM-dependent methyltransferase
MAQLFDPSAYLRANPDVAKAVEEGRMRSAWAHYVSWGHREDRPGVPGEVKELVRSVMEATPRTPPEKLISRVHGTSDAGGFAQVGKMVALDVYGAVAPHRPLGQPMRILDFGCGCGRVLPYMGILASQADFAASDIDREAIAWCRENIRGDEGRERFAFSVNSDLPPLPFEEGSFDLVYAISVFTHLPEDMQFKWLAELERVTAPGGLLVISTAGAHLIREHLGADTLRLLDEKGFYYHPFGSTDGLPDYYQAAWHTRPYVEKAWSRFLEIIDVVPLGIAGHQDLILCRRR